MLGEFWHVVSDQISLKSWVFAPMLLSRPTEFWGGTTSRPVGVRRGRGEKGKEFGRAFNRIQRPVHSGILRLIRTWRSGGWCCVEGVEKEEVSEVYMGNVIQTSLGQNPARQAALFAGTLSDSICSMPACTIPCYILRYNLQNLQDLYSTMSIICFPPLPPLGHSWDVMLVWRKGNIEKKLFLYYSVVYYYNGVHCTSSSYRSVEVIWPVKSSLKWPIMWRVGLYTLLYHTMISTVEIWSWHMANHWVWDCSNVPITLFCWNLDLLITWYIVYSLTALATFQKLLDLFNIVNQDVRGPLFIWSLPQCWCLNSTSPTKFHEYVAWILWLVLALSMG